MSEMDRSPKIRWILAFDSTCASCTRLSRRITIASGGQLETIPIANDLVQKLAALSGDADGLLDRPALFKLDGARVRTWQGRSMVIPLARHLGVRRSIATLSVLGSLVDDLSASKEERSGVSRKSFLRMTAGVGIVGGLVLTGHMPAFAADPVGSWLLTAPVLPTNYDEFSAYPTDYRRGIYAQLSPFERATLWREHLSRWRSRSDITARQKEIIGQVSALTADPELNFGGDSVSVRASAPENLREEFSSDIGAAIFATLGPIDSPTGTRDLCNCSMVDTWCGGAQCLGLNCTIQPTGCGWLWTWPCDGFC